MKRQPPWIRLPGDRRTGHGHPTVCAFLSRHQPPGEDLPWALNGRVVTCAQVTPSLQLNARSPESVKQTFGCYMDT
jgi:hypothetical protein